MLGATFAQDPYVKSAFIEALENAQATGKSANWVPTTAVYTLSVGSNTEYGDRTAVSSYTGSAAMEVMSP